MKKLIIWVSAANLANFVEKSKKMVEKISGKGSDFKYRL
jgi:hypothetical protein